MQTILRSATHLAAVLGVARSTIHRRIERGTLTPTAYLGSRPMFSDEDVEALRVGEQHLPTKEAK